MPESTANGKAKRRVARSNIRTYIQEKTEKTKSSFTGKLGETTVEEALFVLVLGLWLSLNSGYINGLCLSGMLSHEGSRVQGVSAFTGTYTKSGLSLANSDTSVFGFNVFLILCFIAGACISGALNPEAVPHKLVPSYGPTFLIGSLFMILSAIFAELDANGKALFYCAAVANGIQNGMTSMYSANLIRTSHLTGTSTDIGLIAGQMLRGNFKNSWKFKVLVSLASSFWIGGLLAYWSARAFLSHALWFSAGLYMLIGLSHVVFVMLTEKVGFLQSCFGMWEWNKVLKQFSVVNSALNLEDADEDSRHIITQEINEVFNTIDEDNSNSIDVNELSGALTKMGLKVTQQALNAMIKAVDENGNGVIDREEFHALVQLAIVRARNKRDKKKERKKKLILKQGKFECLTTLADGTMTDIDALFDSIDKDGSGTIDEEELFAALVSINMKVTKQAMDTMIEVVDENGDGVLDREEFHALVRLANLRARNKAAKKKNSEMSPLLSEIETEVAYNNDTKTSGHFSTGELRLCGNGQHQIKTDPDAKVRFFPSTVDSNLPRTLDDISMKHAPKHDPIVENDLRLLKLEQNDPRAIIITENKHPFKIVGVNNAWEKLCGYQSSEVISKTMPELIQGPETNREGLQEAMTKLVQGEDVRCITVNYRKDGSSFRNDLSMGPLYNKESGDVEYFVGILKNLGDLAEALDGHGNEEKMKDFGENSDTMVRRIGDFALAVCNGNDNNRTEAKEEKPQEYERETGDIAVGMDGSEDIERGIR